MVGPFIFLTFALLSVPQPQSPAASAVIYGTVVDRDGRPAQEIGLTAMPLGVALAAILPHAKTDQLGRFRLAVPWWGRYTVFAEDKIAGYSQFSTGPGGERTIREVSFSRPAAGSIRSGSSSEGWISAASFNESQDGGCD
jgi:hypothetical protein